MQREGIFREMKLRSHYEKPFEKKTREKAESHPPQRRFSRHAARIQPAPGAIVPQSHVERVVSSLGRLV
jgi:hypothetical protein